MADNSAVLIVSVIILVIPTVVAMNILASRRLLPESMRLRDTSASVNGPVLPPAPQQRVRFASPLFDEPQPRLPPAQPILVRAETRYDFTS